MASRSKDDDKWVTAQIGFSHISETGQFYADVLISRANGSGSGSAMQANK